jgi:hypothetical protein
MNPQAAVWLFPLEDGDPPAFLLLSVEDRYSMFRPQFISRILPHIRERFIYPVEAPPKPVEAPPEPIASSPEPVEAPPKPIEAPPEPIEAPPEPIASSPEPIKAPPEPIKAPPEPVTVASVPPVAAVRRPAAVTVASAPPVEVVRKPEAVRESGAEIKARIIRYGREHGRISGIVFGNPEAAGEAHWEEQIAMMTSPFALTIGLSSGGCLILFPSSMDGGLVAHRVSRSLKIEALCVSEAKDPEGIYEALKPYM